MWSGVFPYKKFTGKFTYGNSISYVNSFNFTCERKVSYVKLILVSKCSILHVRYIFHILRFHMWNFEPIPFTYELGISLKISLKMFRFHMWNENFMSLVRTLSSYTLRKTFWVSDGNQTVTFWSLVRCSNHGATQTQMASEGYICKLVRIDGRHMYCQSASLDMSSIILVLINDVIVVVIMHLIRTSS